MVLKVCREFDDVTLAGKLFHVSAAATGNARSLTVDSRVDGTSNADVDDDRMRFIDETNIQTGTCCNAAAELTSRGTQTGSTPFVLMDKILCWYLWILKISKMILVYNV